MKSLAKNILKDIEKLSFDNMDEFDKYDYFKNNMLKNIEWLCKQTLNEKPMIITETSNDCISKIEDSLLEEYHDNSEVVIGEMLSNVGVNNISLEKAASLYASLMNEVEGDLIVQIYNNSISETDLDELGDYRKL